MDLVLERRSGELRRPPEPRHRVAHPVPLVRPKARLAPPGPTATAARTTTDALRLPLDPGTLVAWAGSGLLAIALTLAMFWR
jgi:hypothetical protein